MRWLMRFKHIQDWLGWIKSHHKKTMDLGLERVAKVAERLNLLQPNCPVITVAGTNGKGSCVAGLEAIYLAAGYRVGAFTSPYLFRINEEIRIQGKEIGDEKLCQAFACIEKALDDVTLTPFEFITLAALAIFQQANLDICILEVGLGGRLDAVNIINADVAVVASIAIDHADVLGDTREAIAREKAGIFRAHKPAVCGDFSPPNTLIDYAREINAPLFCQEKEFYFRREETSWSWRSKKKHFENLSLPTIALQNMATVLMAIELLQSKLNVNRHAIDVGLTKINLPGRIQVIPGDITRIFDVSHNPAAAEFLATYLRENNQAKKTRAVFSMLVDKDILGTILVMKELIDEWHIAPLPVERGTPINKLAACFQAAKIKNFSEHASVADAYQAAMTKSKSNEQVVVFGSFYTVAAAIGI